MQTDTSTAIRMLLAAAIALAMLMGLSLVLFQFSALAQPGFEITALTVEKSASADVVAPGDILTYTITIREPRIDMYDRLWLTDVLPSNVTYVPGSLQPVYGKGQAGFANGVITWTASNFGLGNFAIITFSVQVSPNLTYETIVNTAQVTGSGQLLEDSAETIVIAEMGNLDVSGTRKRVSRTQAEPGEVLVYTITLSNDDSGHPVPAVQVVDHLPAGLQLRPDSVTVEEGSYIVSGNTITWMVNIGEYWHGIDLRFEADIWPTYKGWITNIAEISTPPDTTFIRSSESTYVQQLYPLMEADKSVTPGLVHLGEYLTYTIHVANQGEGEAFPVWVTDTLPPQVQYVAGVASMGSFGESNGVLTWNVTAGPSGTLLFPPAQTASLTFTVFVSLPETSGSTPIYNTAYVTADGQLISAQAETYFYNTVHTYLPIVYRRWPPIPYTPILYDINNPDKQPDYTVQWHYDYDVPATYYTLQESTSGTFPAGQTTEYTVQHAGVDTSKTFTGKEDGTYYYRVRAHNDYGYSPWSDVKSVVVYTIYYDDFSDSGSGWPQRSKLVIPSSSTYYRLRYESGHYRIMIDQGGPDIWFHQPDAFAPYIPPSDKYCIETYMRFQKMQPPYDNKDWDFYPYWGNAGLIFGANESNTHLYALCLAVGSKERMGWFLVDNPTYEYPKKGCNYVPGKVGGEDADIIKLDVNQWHLLQVGVDGNHVTVYIDGIYKGYWKMDGLSAMTRIGVVGGDYEVTPVDIRYDYFKVTPNQPCSQADYQYNRPFQIR